MFRCIKLVFLCAVTLSYNQLVKSDCDVQRISEAILNILLPIIQEMRDNLNYVKRDMNSLNESVSNLEEHMNQTISELADLHTSLQSSINKSHAEQQSEIQNKMDKLNSKLVKVTRKLRSVEDSLDTKLDKLNLKLVSVTVSVTKELRSVENQVNAVINPLNSQLVSVHNTSALMRDVLNCMRSDLNSLKDSVNQISDSVEEHENHTTTELMKLDQNLHRIFTQHTVACGGTEGWRRAVYLDMTDPTSTCPDGWNRTEYSKSTCGRASDGRNTCDSVTFPVSGGEYSHVCGRIKAYQWGWTGGFGSGSGLGTRTVDNAYFTGVAVMHGSPRQHIWTFAAGASENYVTSNGFVCPCDIQYAGFVPQFVGEDYFCESGLSYPWTTSWFTFHSRDTLWDGRDCHSSSTCCTLHNPPYFTKSLSTPTTDDIELRMCLIQGISRMNIAVELIELYVK